MVVDTGVLGVGQHEQEAMSQTQDDQGRTSAS